MAYLNLMFAFGMFGAAVYTTGQVLCKDEWSSGARTMALLCCALLVPITLFGILAAFAGLSVLDF